MISIDANLLNPVLAKASVAERKRSNFNFHKIPGDTLQRMLNVMNTGTYVRPHKHEDPDKREAFIILEGKVAAIEFDESGNPVQCIVMDPKKKVYGCEIEPRKWHSLICLENNSVLYEIKDGPYSPITDKDFASWAPIEGSSNVPGYISQLIQKLKLDP